jgi:NAD(P)-dependent dehydrogenase (short-subunit alcohol dehydrogenase family)
MDPRLKGRTALVTGGARGIGAATCDKLAREGAAVVVADVLDAEGRAIASSLEASGGRAIYTHLDVSSEAQWSAAVETTMRVFGALQILVNNAGIARIEDVETETLEGFQRLISINQTGAWLGMRAAAPVIRRAGGGSIINVSSIYGAVGGNGAAHAYHASKGALRLMTKNAAIRYAKEGIRVNSVHPGFIETPMVEPYVGPVDGAPSPMGQYVLANTPMGRIGRPGEVASVIAFLAGDEASYMTGSEVYVDGGWTAA